MKKKSPNDIAGQIRTAAIKATDPALLIFNQIYRSGNKLLYADHLLELDKYKHIYILGAGKAAAGMCKALETILGDNLTTGAAVVKYGHGAELKKIRIFEAAHPVPDQNTLIASREIINLAKQADEQDLVFFLLSGGGSALFEMLPDEISLADLIDLNEVMLASGAAIEEINTIRKHISLVKGGRLAKLIAPARCETLILSDIIDDPIQSIASGPTSADSTSFAEAVDIINHYGLTAKIPKSIMLYLNNGIKGRISETPDEQDQIFKQVQNHIIGNNRLALEAMAICARSLGCEVEILSDCLEGEAREIAKFWAALIKFRARKKNGNSPPLCLIAGGEPTVTLAGSGKGGRNQELVLAVLNQLKQFSLPFYFNSLGTDGTDGPTDAAGAWIDNASSLRVQKHHLDIQKALATHDAYPFFKALNNLIITGPTGTNVMDVMFCLI